MGRNRCEHRHVSGPEFHFKNRQVYELYHELAAYRRNRASIMSTPAFQRLVEKGIIIPVEPEEVKPIEER